jgi:hypothetical protein
MVVMGRRALLLLLVGSVFAVASASSQPVARRVTNLEALLAFPGFYHLRPVTIAGTVALGGDGRLRLTTDAGSIQVVTRERALDGLSEVRGEFWDLGRMSPDDPRLAAYDVRETFGLDPEGLWPRPGMVTAFIAGAVVPTTVPAVPTIRTLVLHPSRYLDQTVRVVGQFSGRNLLGDLPDAPANSPFDFVLRSAEGMLWVSHIRPRGHDFTLALDARQDTNRWLQVTGVLHQARGLQWLDASKGTVELSKPPVETPSTDFVRVPSAPPPEVLFSAPTEGEIDVQPVRGAWARSLISLRTGNHRIQDRLPVSEPGP